MDNNIRKSVGIFGAGIAGLSAAHELSIVGYDVYIYESDDSIGGMAKSYRYKNGLPTEYSWRGYGQFYKNVYHIMNNIPSPTDNSKTVYDTELSRPVKFILVKDNIVDSADANNWTRNFSTKEWIVIFLQMCREMASDNRAGYYATINATDYLKQKTTPRNLSYMISIFGPWLGIDPHRTSLHHLANFFRMIQYPDLSEPYVHTADTDGNEWIQESGSQWLVLKRPTSESWFDPWTKFLKKNYGVKIYLNCKLNKFNIVNGKIISAEVITTDKKLTVFHDYYILATTPFSAKDIIDRSGPIAQSDPQLKLFRGLISDGPHIQVSFRIGFADKIVTPQKYMAFILPDSEFNITFYFQNWVWHPDVYLGPGNKTLISGTACISYVPGKIFNKPITDLTEHEFKEEILFQMFRCKNLNGIISKYNYGRKLSDFPVNIFEIWKGWHFTEPNSNEKLKFEEMKWVNSTNTNQFMPEITTSFPNLFLAGAHIKSSVDLYSMETACATGRDAAFKIIGQNQRALVVNKPIWMSSVGKLDNVLYKFNLPSIIDVTLIVLFMIIIFFIIKKIKK